MKPEVKALLDEILGPEPKPQPPRPKVVVSDDVVIRDADVVVSPADPNASADQGVVKVRRPEPEPPPPMRSNEVRINMAAAERQYWQREHDRAADRAQRRALDPVGLGHWGRSDE
jgi:hypothetical protein